MAKTEVYSWRVTPEVKAALEEEARARGVSLAGMLDQIANEWLSRSSTAVTDDNAEQQRLQAAAQPHVGAIRGGEPQRATEARQRVRVRLRRHHAAG